MISSPTRTYKQYSISCIADSPNSCKARNAAAIASNLTSRRSLSDPTARHHHNHNHNPQHSVQSTNLVALAPISTTTTTSTPTSILTAYQTPPAALGNMPTPLATSTIPSTTATALAKPLLEPHPDLLPDWPPILAIFLLSWLVMAWVATIVLFLASFPEKVAWLDRGIERLKAWMSGRNRYIHRKNHWQTERGA